MHFWGSAEAFIFLYKSSQGEAEEMWIYINKIHKSYLFIFFFPPTRRKDFKEYILNLSSSLFSGQILRSLYNMFLFFFSFLSFPFITVFFLRSAFYVFLFPLVNDFHVFLVLKFLPFIYFLFPPSPHTHTLKP